MASTKTSSWSTRTSTCSYRARLAGYRCWYAADAVVRHAGSGTLGVMSLHGRLSRPTEPGVGLVEEHAERVTAADDSVASRLLARRGSALRDEGARGARLKGKISRSPGTSAAHGEAATRAARAPRSIQQPRASSRTRLDCPQAHREGTLASTVLFRFHFSNHEDTLVARRSVRARRRCAAARDEEVEATKAGTVCCPAATPAGGSATGRKGPSRRRRGGRRVAVPA